LEIQALVPLIDLRRPPLGDRRFHFGYASPAPLPLDGGVGSIADNFPDA
jgi:hypothetical protein